MRKAILIILGVIAVLVLGFLGIVAMQPTEFSMTRKATISAPPAVVFDQVNNLHKWDAWSPWAKLDPNAKYTFAGPEAGEGSKQSWAGNDKVGEGSMLITESRPNEKIAMQLEFMKPKQDPADVTFTFQPTGDAGEATDVTWSMSFEHTFMSKAMCMFMNMDKMIGDEFEKGLASLKEVSEKAAAEVTMPAVEDETRAEESAAD